MRYIITALLMIMSTYSFAQSDFDISKDEQTGSLVYKGECTFTDIEKEPSFSWLQRGAEAYKADSATLAYLKKNLPAYRLVVFLGTWCDDSHFFVPQLYSILQKTGYPMQQYKMFGVDRAKTSKYEDHKLYRIDKVPTIIVIKGNIEVGRITETVKKSMEGDLARIIEKDLETKTE